MANTTTYRPVPATGNAYSYSQLKQIWIDNGGSPVWAPTMAAVALAESGGNPTEINNNPSTMDYSVGLWQINYYGALLGPRTAAYGPPSALLDPNENAKAAINLLGNGSGLRSGWGGDRAAQLALANGGGPMTDAQGKSFAATGGYAVTGNGAPYTPSSGAGAPGSSPTGSASTSGAGCDSTKYLINASPFHFINECQAKALKGAAFILAGGTIMLVGVVLLIGHKSKLPAPIEVAVGYVAGKTRGVKAASPGPSAPELASANRMRAQQDQQNEFALAQARGRANGREAGPFPEE